MKKKILLSIPLALIAALLIWISKTNKKILPLQHQTITELRIKHQSFLDKSPFKKTLKMSKAERKKNRYPATKYYERMWELTMNPQKGYPEPEKVLKLQQELTKNKPAARFPGNGVIGNDWVDRGPNNVGGRTRVVLFDPNDPTNKRVFAGGVSGGLWVNNDITNANSSWSLVQGVPGNMNISCITVDPNNSNIWYLGTGEQYTFGAAVGNGVYKTTDGGVNWTNIPVQLAGGNSFEYNANNTFLAGIYFINDIQAWNNNGTTEIFLGVGAHVYSDAANPDNWLGLQSAGLYRSVNGGTNWSRIEAANMRFNVDAIDYYFTPNDFEIGADNKLWMGTIGNTAFGDGGGRIFSSVNGTTWTEAADSPLPNSNRVELAVSKSLPNKLYALTEGDNPYVPSIFATENAFGNTTGSSTITLAKPNDRDNGIPSDDFTRGQAFYDLVIEVDPTNHDIIYVGGINLFRSTSGRSTNTANKWAQISKWSENASMNLLNCSYVHADQHAFTFRPGANNQAVIGCDGGVFYASSLSNAANSDVISARNKDFNVTQFYYGGYGPSTSNELIIAGAQDNGSQFMNGAVPGANSSTDVYGGDGAFSAIDKDGNYMIVSYVYSSHEYYNLPYNGTGYTIDNADEGDFINQADLDENLNIMYSNGSNGSPQINRYALTPTGETKQQFNSPLLNSSPTAFKISPYTTTSTTLLVGTQNGKLLKLTNANSTNTANITWEEITGELFLGSISDIEFGATENDIFVTFHNYGVESVWYTSNAGVTWKSKEGNLPDMPVKSILQNPLAPNEVIVGTELGIWATKNFNHDTPNWTSAYNGMRDVKVLDLDLRAADNSILATTFGRGVFTGQFTNETDATFLITSTNPAVEICAPNNAVFTLDFTAIAGFNAVTNLTVSGVPSGATATLSQQSINTTGSFTLTIGNTNNIATGNYIITVTGSSGGQIVSTDLVLQAITSSPVITTSPQLNATNIPAGIVNFSWQASLGAVSYDFDIATDAGFGNIIESTNTTNNFYTNAISLNEATVYYWRVRAISSCVTSDYSQTQKFQTALPLGGCFTFSNSNTIAIPDGNGANIPGSAAISVINIAQNYTIADVNVTVNISHTYIQDLVISLIAPNNDEYILLNRACNGEDNLSVVFDDDGTTITCGVQPITGTILPENPLAGLINENALGNWTLSVLDYYNQDTGSINNWSIEICENEAVTNSTLVKNTILTGTNSIHQITPSEIQASSIGSTATEQLFMLTELPLKGELKLNNIALTLGDSFSQNDIDLGNVTYVNASSIAASDLFVVDVTNATGGFLPNEQIAISIDASLGIDDAFFEKTGTKVFPTVSNGSFSITSSNNLGNTLVEIYTLSGQRVYVNNVFFRSGDLQTITVNKFATGIYILKLSSNGLQGSKKLVFE